MASVAVVVKPALAARSVAVADGTQVMLFLVACVPGEPETVPSVMTMLLPLTTIVDGVPVAPKLMVVVV